MELTKPWWQREDHPFHQSKSAVECFQRCPREFHNRYCLELEPKGSSTYLDRGTAFGAAVAAWWMYPQGEPGWKDLRRRTAQETLVANESYGCLPKYQQVLTRALVDAYDTVYRVIEVPVATGAEVEIVGVLNSGVYSRGLADVVVDRPGKPKIIVEFKTTESDIGDGTWYWERLRYDAQVAGYWNGSPDARIIYDVTRVPVIKPFKATPIEKQSFYRRNSKCGKYKPGDPKRGTRVADETLDEFYDRAYKALTEHRFTYFRRKELSSTPEEKQALTHDLGAWARQILQAAKYGEWPRKPSACKRGKTGLCGFYPSCYEGAPLQIGPNYAKRERH